MSEQNGSSGPQALAQRGAQLHEGLRALLQKSLPRLNEIASTVLKPERLIRAVLGAASRTPELLECTPASIMQCVMISAQLGLEPNTPLGHFYLVPFKNRKTGKKEATPIIGYRGLVDLARRGGQVATIEAHIVHENDPHEVKFGRELKLWHTPCLKGDAGKPLFGYAVATMKDGAVQAEVMTWAEIMKIRDRSKARENGPWVTDPEEMGKKTVFRRLSKWLPLSTEFSDALSAEEDEERPALPDILQIELPPAENAKSTRTETVKEQVKKATGVIIQQEGETEQEARARHEAGSSSETPKEEPLDQITNEEFDSQTGELREPGAD